MRVVFTEKIMRTKCLGLAAAVLLLGVAAPRADAAEVKVLTAGAFKQVLLALAPSFEKAGNTLVIKNDTVGGVVKMVEGGEPFDVVIVSPGAVDDLIQKGKVAAGSRAVLAQVGVGVVVKAGAPKPDIGTVDAFKRALLDAKSVAYIDPASGGSSGIFVAKLLDGLGIAEQVKPKAKLIPGGAVADHVADGEAEIGVHQISEILPVKGATLVGPLPAEIQNYTTYAAGVSAAAKDAAGAQALIKLLSGPEADAVLKEKGMQRAAR
jgi:molybdate transport system substrate-binding protein